MQPTTPLPAMLVPVNGPPYCQPASKAQPLSMNPETEILPGDRGQNLDGVTNIISGIPHRLVELKPVL